MFVTRYKILLLHRKQMGSTQEFSFDINREIYGLNSMKLHSTSQAVDRYSLVLQEYEKMLAYDKSRCNLVEKIKKTNEMKKMKDSLKNIRHASNSKSNPYQKDTDGDEH